MAAMITHQPETFFHEPQFMHNNWGAAYPAVPSEDLSGLYAVGTREMTTGQVIWGVLATASAAASAYHGYKRNESIGWAIAWFLLGGMFPVITPVVAVAQGYGKPAFKTVRV